LPYGFDTFLENLLAGLSLDVSQDKREDRENDVETGNASARGERGAATEMDAAV
jgi:hypothetical protein